MANVAVFIGTTTGPNRVMRILEADYYNVSSVGIRIRTQQSSLSRPYHDFVSYDTGVIARHTHNDKYRLDLAEEIDDGNSWNLGVFVAHKLAFQDSLATIVEGDPLDLSQVDHVIWATGEVDADHNVGAVAEVDRKLTVSNELFRRAADAGCKLTILIPQANYDDQVSARLAEITGYAADIQVRPIEKVSFFDSDPEPAPTTGQSKRMPILLGCLLLLVCGVGAAVLVDDMTGDTPDSTAALPPQLQLTWLGLPEGGGCLDDLIPLATQALDWSQVNPAPPAGKVCRLWVESAQPPEHSGVFTAAGRGVVLRQTPIGPDKPISLDVPVYNADESHIQLELHIGDRSYRQIVNVR